MKKKTISKERAAKAAQGKEAGSAMTKGQIFEHQMGEIAQAEECARQELAQLEKQLTPYRDFLRLTEIALRHSDITELMEIAPHFLSMAEAESEHCHRGWQARQGRFMRARQNRLTSEDVPF